MTLVVIGPVTHDLIVIGGEKSHNVGGATYFQSFVFEKFYNDYLAIVNCSDLDLAFEFPDINKVKVIMKSDTHYFINDYPDGDNRDYREQLSNFANIPIYPSDLEEILPDKIDAFVLNPLNRYDFPIETIEYIKSFNVPVFMSIQGFLRIRGVKLNDNYGIELSNCHMLNSILDGINSIFLDEGEANIIGTSFDVDEMVITNGSSGSRILSNDGEIRIEAVECDDVVDTTGCGDTYMAAYVSEKLLSSSSKDSANFASLIASEKIRNFGHY